MKLLHLVTTCLISIAMAVTATNISNSINSFSDKVYKVLPKDESNLIFSPFSLHAALSLAYQGAANKTAHSLEEVLNLQDTNATAVAYKSLMTDLRKVEKINIQVAYRMYVKAGYKFKEDFSSVAKNYFNADAQAINFVQRQEAADEINGWVKQNTNSKIDNLVKPDDFGEDTAAVLLNAIYFKGNWLQKFNKAHTRKDKFHVSENVSADCDMMHIVGNFEYDENHDLDAKILKLRYEDYRFAMIIVLPNSKTGLGELEKKLRSVDVADIYMIDQKVDVALPKFRIESTIDLKEPLKKAGLEGIFDDTADFSNLIETDRPLVVSKVVQKAFIEVNEEGSEAAAATGIGFEFRIARREEPFVFKADHPFMFYITAELDRDSARGQVLFMGTIENPTAGS